MSLFSNKYALTFLVFCLACGLENTITNSSKGREYIIEAIKDQIDFCANQPAFAKPYVDSDIRSRAINVFGVQFTMYAYTSHDSMSEAILELGGWENTQLNIVLLALERYKQKKGINSSENLTVMDMGANVGYYTYVLANKGYRVVAFEPAIENMYVLRKTYCLNQNKKVLLLNLGLSDVEKTCPSFSGIGEYSNRQVYCNMTPPAGLINRGNVRITRLNNFAWLFNNIAFIKIDVEGYEAMAVSGGKKIFYEAKVPYIQMEFVWDRLVEHGANPGELLVDFTRNGYDIHQNSFDGPIYSVQSLTIKTTFPWYLDLFFTHQQTS